MHACTEQPGNVDSTPLGQCHHPVREDSPQTPAVPCVSGLPQQDTQHPQCPRTGLLPEDQTAGRLHVVCVVRSYWTCRY